MTKLSLWLDKRERQDGTSSIKFRVYHTRTFYLSSGISVPKEIWKNGQIAGSSKTARLRNALLRKKYDTLDRLLINLEDCGKLRALSDVSLKKVMKEAISNRPLETRRFVSFMQDYISAMQKFNTVRTYTYTMSKIEEYDPKASFSTITPEWLQSFENYLIKTGMQTNSRCVIFRSIRAVFNYAITKEWTELYPFRRFKFSSEITKQDSHLSVQQLADIINTNVSGKMRIYRDLFLLMFYLCGINPVDLLANPTTHIEGDRLLYTRSKTGKKYSIKIEPEAKLLLDKYIRKSTRASGFLRVTTSEKFTSFMCKMNRHIKEICRPTYSEDGKQLENSTEAIEPNLTAYWARHTYATIAISLGIPKDYISMSLGHSMGARITDVYIDYAIARKNIDETNRKIIDFVNTLRK